MKGIFLYGTEMDTEEHVYTHIKEQFGFPDEFHHSLEGLFEILLLVDEEIEVTLQNYEIMCNNLGEEYAETFVDLFAEATERNENITFYIEEVVFTGNIQ